VGDKLQFELIDDDSQNQAIHSDPSVDRDTPLQYLTAIESHPLREEIIKHIIDRDMSNREIARTYGISHGSINRYIKGRLVSSVADAAVERGIDLGSQIQDRVEEIYEEVQRLCDGFKDSFGDPDNPSKLNLSPRASEIDIIYEEMGEDEKIHVKKQSLDKILNEISSQGYFPLTIQYKMQDPRKLLIDALALKLKPLELLAKIEGKIKDQVTNNITIPALIVLPKEEMTV
jgi:predicted XRE-type DNA-binding protein